MKKFWLIFLVGISFISALLLQQERRLSFSAIDGVSDCKKIDQNIRLLYERGLCGRVMFIPESGHRIVWHPPGQKTLSPSDARGKTAVTYGLSGGRLGDNLLSYLHARWIAHRDHVPLAWKSFPMAEEFALAYEPHPVIEEPAVEIPYFPEPSMKNHPPFLVDWEDPGFREEIARCLTPVKPHCLLELPADRITVCVHVRRGGACDSLAARNEYPLKFPPDSYYVKQIRTIARIFHGKPLYVFLMTDDLHPEELVKRYQKAVACSRIQWECRKKLPEDCLDDFFSIPRFDCLILCDSNFSIVASKLADYSIKIAPTHYVKKKGKAEIIGLDIAFNPAYKKVDASHEKILIAGVCQNTEKAIPAIIDNAEKLGRHFKDYAVLIYENNSTDRTPLLFAEWAEKNPHVNFMSETLESFSQVRTERIAYARNQLLTMARRPEYADFKYIVMADLDFTIPWPIERIVQNIERGGDWDMISANGIRSNGSYYDRYAFRSITYPFGPELLGPWWRLQLNREKIYFTSKELIEVFSAFGGLAIYKTDSILPFAYSGFINRSLGNFYKKILLTYRGKEANSQIQEYVRQLGLKPKCNLERVPIVFVENTPEEHPEDLRRVTCCEHLPLHAAMAQHGHGKFFIDPQMVMIYFFP